MGRSALVRGLGSSGGHARAGGARVDSRGEEEGGRRVVWGEGGCGGWARGKGRTGLTLADFEVGRLGALGVSWVRGRVRSRGVKVVGVSQKMDHLRTVELVDSSRCSVDYRRSPVRTSTSTSTRRGADRL